MRHHALALVTIVAAACGPTKSTERRLEQSLETRSTKTTQLAKGDLVDAATPRLDVTGTNDTITAAVQKIVGAHPLTKKGALVVEVTVDPAMPPAEGTLVATVRVRGTFAHLPEVTQLEATIAGRISYAGVAHDEIGQTLGTAVAAYLDREKLPASVGVPTAAPTKAVAITVGPPHCTRHEDGSVRCWERGDAPLPLPAVAGSRAVDAANNYGVCGIRDSGRAYCIDAWDNTIANEARDVCGVDSAVAIGAGQDLACAVQTDGRVKCWGARPDWFEPCRDKRAFEIKGITDAVAIDVGPFRGCALTKASGVMCWDHGTSPTAKPHRALARAVHVLAGFETCGILGGPRVVVRCLDKLNRLRDAVLTEPVKKLVGTRDGGCALADSGLLYCWRTGQARATPVRGLPVLADVGADITGLCGIGIAGDVVCWEQTSGTATPAPVTFRY